MREKQSVRLAGRLFELVNLIVNHPREFTAPKLAEHFRTSVRTIRRDIRLLEDIGIRVESEPTGGYFVMRDLSRVPTTLTEVDRLALEIMPWLLRGSLLDGRVNSLVTAYQHAIDKILGRPASGTAPKTLVTNTSQPDGSIVPDLAGSMDASDDRLMLDILHAIRNSRRMEIEYRKVGENHVEVRRIDPYYLVPWQNSLYVIGFCHLRKAFRTFKVGRMQNVRCLTETFARDPHFSLREFLKSAWGIDQSGPEVDVTLSFEPNSAGYAREEIRSHRVMHEVYLPDGRYVVRVRAHWNKEFMRFVLQYGSAVEVVDPQALRHQLREEAERMLGRYQHVAQEYERMFR
jgi:predicted DNA-binding transcriptional regulator YafY